MGGLNGGLGVINENHSASNQSSIVCTILDPTGRPLHYFSGDAEHEMDSVLAKWINSGNDEFSIPIMKLSHHGSTSNNPTSMFDALKPKNMIISAGNLHGHPSEYTGDVLWESHRLTGAQHGRLSFTFARSGCVIRPEAASYTQPAGLPGSTSPNSRR